MKPRTSNAPVYNLSEVARDSNLPLRLRSDEFTIQVDIQHLDDSLMTGPYRSNFFLILLVLKGAFRIKINLKDYTAKKNNLLVIGANDLRQFLSADKACVLSGVAFTANFLGQTGISANAPEAFSYFSTRFSPVWKLIDKDAKAIKVAYRLLYERELVLEQHPFGKQILHNTFNNFVYELAALSNKYVQAASTALSRKENLVIRFVNLVQLHFIEQRDLQSYAAKLNVTPKYLTETVKEIAGKTAGQIIDDFVVQEAKLILDNPQLSIGEIADLLHFSDQSHFGKFFKRNAGVSPKLYRRQFGRISG
ncbi:AraC family transcriptional regulator [Dyadobacter sp. OTU695]|uniref:AraC family transcriptional regulator n=1 Tax=Dyadobacter sp. OTU695 TaxID=3043860 RepID=UPI00313D9D7A